MGQTNPTEGMASSISCKRELTAHVTSIVYCYFAEDTVERNILDLAARRGQSLYTKENAAGTLDASAFASGLENNTVDSPMKKKSQKGDFVFRCVAHILLGIGDSYLT